MIYCFYLFDRDGVCLYYEDWNRSTKPKSLPGAADGGGGPRSAAPRTALAPPPPGRGCPGTRPRAAVAAVPLGMLRRMLTRITAPAKTTPVRRGAKAHLRAAVLAQGHRVRDAAWRGRQDDRRRPAGLRLHPRRRRRTLTCTPQPLPPSAAPAAGRRGARQARGPDSAGVIHTCSHRHAAWRNVATASPGARTWAVRGRTRRLWAKLKRRRGARLAS